MKDCPLEDVLVSLLEGSLSEEREADLHDHLDGCSACRALLACVGGEAGSSRGGGSAGDSMRGTATALSPGSPAAKLTPGAPGVVSVTEATPAPVLHVGDMLLGKYRVERILGQGSMGAVVAVLHVELGELFAMKVMLPEALKSPQALSRFLREARAAARLKSEHAVRVFDVGRLDERSPYMVMEHLNGSDLKELIRERGPLAPERAASYLLQICDVLGEAHGQGIIHRDLKPSNLFLTRRPNGAPCVKVIDFGISKLIDSDGKRITGSGVVMGSPFYMSPEQMRGSMSIDARSDIWSLGVVLYELVTGRVPFEEKNFAQLVWRVVNEEPPAPTSARPELPPWVDDIALRCLQKSPEQRFQTVADLAAALRTPTRASYPPSSGRRSRPRLVRRR